MRSTRIAAGAAVTIAALAAAQLCTAAPAAAAIGYASVHSPGLVNELRMACDGPSHVFGPGGRGHTRSDFDGDRSEDLVSFGVDQLTGHRVVVVQLTGLRCVFYGPAAADSIEAVATGDLDHDGYDDLALGMPGHFAGAGAVWVVPGHPSGFDISFSSYWQQNTAGVPGEGNAGDGFGSALAVGDLTDDGYAELAIGAPGEQSGAFPGAGAVTVLYGSASDLTTTGAQRFHTGLASVPGEPAGPDEAFGRALAIGDVTGDGSGDLAIGSAAGDGSVMLLQGSATGVVTTGADVVTGAEVSTANVTVHGFGDLLTAADVTGDGLAEVIAGAPDSDVKGKAAAGAVVVLEGRPGGIAATARQLLGQGSTPGIPGTPTAGDRFGAAVATGEIDGTAPFDLAVGGPGEDIAGQADAGVVAIVPGAPVLGVGSTQVTVSSLGMNAQPTGQFGTWLTVVDRWHDNNQGDLAVGMPNTPDGTVPDSGVLFIFEGVPGGQQVDETLNCVQVQTPTDVVLRHLGSA
ncbi:hypothetical protein CS0771_27820 [Catellatospora sp. IY07-71]|uniref:FG-GAP repeat protein n=1 Tax=Catellatospora sp. IY07-71 TaxID=2728827 RepID=UPI001BB39F8E|nr:FG-GAP repeat protein [Catellatospora sp. IY07-71]BCJ73238.1 hypothetical protein CS0771_27820 [Catellatospora sp. IY07-71]